MNSSVALNMFLTQWIREKSIPFITSMEVSNARLISTMEEVEAIEPDWLLIYKKDNNNLILFLIETRSHSDLF